MKIKIKKCPPKSGPKMMAGGGDPLGPLGVSALVSARNYIRRNDSGKVPTIVTDGDYEYQIDKPFDLENSQIYSRRLGPDGTPQGELIPWTDTNMGKAKRTKALANLRASFPDTFSPLGPSLDDFLQSSAQTTDQPEGASTVAPGNRPNSEVVPMLPPKDIGRSTPPYTPTKPNLGIQQDNSNPLFNMLEQNLQELESENTSTYRNDLKDSENLFRRKNQLNVGASIANTLQGLQDTTYEAPMANTSLLTSKYRRMPLSALEQQAAALRSQTAAAGRELLKEGLRPTEIGAILGNLQGRVAAAESDLRFNFFDKNTSLDRSRFGDLQSRIDVNEKSRIAAEQASRDDRNKLLSAQVDNIQKTLDNRDKLITDEHLYNRNVTKGYTDNRMSLLQNRVNLYGLKDRSEKARQDTDKYMSELSRYFDEYKKKYLSSK